jgi:cytidylate kinase
MIKPIFIGLTGNTGVGKDTVAKILNEHYLFKRLAFGDPLKRAVQIAFSLEDRWLQDDHKTIVHPYWDITPREMFQKTGTEAMRGTFGDDFWVRRLKLEYNQLLAANSQQFIVITDVRKIGVETEPAWIREMGGTVVHMEGPQRRDDVSAAHVSNDPVTFVEGDRKLRNTGDMRELTTEVHALMQDLLGWTK